MKKLPKEAKTGFIEWYGVAISAASITCLLFGLIGVVNSIIVLTGMLISGGITAEYYSYLKLKEYNQKRV